jgi:16S rRNA (guanine966-N2)-methyltransferase
MAVAGWKPRAAQLLGVGRLRVLDLFAGSGALGIEALSRGAASAVFVERAPRALEALRANLEALGIDRDRAEVRALDARA